MSIVESYSSKSRVNNRNFRYLSVSQMFSQSHAFAFSFLRESKRRMLLLREGGNTRSASQMTHSLFSDCVCRLARPDSFRCSQQVLLALAGSPKRRPNRFSSCSLSPPLSATTKVGSLDAHLRCFFTPKFAPPRPRSGAVEPLRLRASRARPTTRENSPPLKPTDRTLTKLSHSQATRERGGGDTVDDDDLWATILAQPPPCDVNGSRAPSLDYQPGSKSVCV